ncbi:MAG: hypothetical protein PUG09_07575 [Prevotella sp.]|nr:hypothetical protein [Prevotella sp.]
MMIFARFYLRHYHMYLYRCFGQKYIDQYRVDGKSPENFIYKVFPWLFAVPLVPLMFCYIHFVHPLSDHAACVVGVLTWIALEFYCWWICRNLKKENFFNKLWDELEQMDKGELRRKTRFHLYTLIIPTVLSWGIVLLIIGLIKYIFG